ncbi:STM4015 family protein [Kitasatospora sp. DSM 101779]|uniref:STM4015 family protein n=1 Tax=Kitasatospora sp. DSM 101779 TaxID=2853165 RepID=UPI0021DB2A76|nr:STM4015 family protein [Kitasatospora sp. DSM 101779]MCU7822864.1 STM4015 family protein [Kitasatospora sp. DSM 101779]
MSRTFHGLPVCNVLTTLDAGEELPAAGAAAWRISLGYRYGGKTEFAEAWQRFLDAVDTTRVRALVIGAWWAGDYDGLDGPLGLIVDSADRLPALEALFVADVSSEECEISWLEMCDITPLFESFPRLTDLAVRGGNGLRLRPVRHERLRSLAFESGGLPARVVRAVGECDFPVLEELDLWLGVDEYGGDHTLEDIAPLLTATRLPALRSLGLQNSEYQDDIAAAVAQAPVVARLEHLALGMGVLTDEGAAALLEGQPLTHLASLDLHHHYLTEEMQQRVAEALAGVDVDLSEAEDEEDEEDRYVAVSE